MNPCTWDSIQLPIISGRHNRRQIFLDAVLIGIVRAADPAGDGPPPARVWGEPLRGLIDTGATATSITPAAAQKMSLRVAGKKDIATANGWRRAKFYHFQIGAFPDSNESEGRAQWPDFLPSQIDGAEFIPLSHGFDILLGMDFVCQGDLTIRRNGAWTFEF